MVEEAMSAIGWLEHSVTLVNATQRGILISRCTRHSQFAASFPGAATPGGPAIGLGWLDMEGRDETSNYLRLFMQYAMEAFRFLGALIFNDQRAADHGETRPNLITDIGRSFLIFQNPGED